MLHKGFMLVYSPGYDEPDIYGPFDTYEDALERYREDLIKSGADIDDMEFSIDLYYTDDTAMIGRYYGL